MHVYVSAAGYAILCCAGVCSTGLDQRQHDFVSAASNPAGEGRGVVWRPNVCGTLQFSLFLIGVRDICVSAELYFISLLESSLV